MFRMTRNRFKLLYDIIITGVGEQVFKLTPYINAFLRHIYQTYDVNINTTKGCISRQFDVANTLRLVSGGTTLDL